MSRTNHRALESENAALRDRVAALEEQNLVLESLAGDAEKHLAQCQRNCENLVRRNRQLLEENDQLGSRLSAYGYDPWSES